MTQDLNDMHRNGGITGRAEPMTAAARLADQVDRMAADMQDEAHREREGLPPPDPFDDWEPADSDDPHGADNVTMLFQRGDHVELAQRLVGRLRKSPTTFTDGNVYQYHRERGVFSIVQNPVLSRQVQAFAGAKVKGGKPLKLRATDVTGAIKLSADLLAEPDFFDGAKRGIAFRDCFMEVGPSGLTRRDHSPDHRARFAYPWGYAHEDEPTQWLGFLEQVFRDDDDLDQKIALLQEYVGISLLGLATRFQRALVLLGDGANGKGVFSSVVERCMPPGSVCAIPPQDAGQEYRRAMLAGKLLNIVSELPEADILDSESWKSIVAGDTTTGREIRKEPFTFKPIAGHIYSANRLPGTTDQSHGFWRRLSIVRFNRVFQEHEQNPDLADELARTEAQAIVAWALAGAQRALEAKRYTMPDSSKSALEDWKRAADQVRAFTEEWTEPLDLGESPTAGAQADCLYKSYREWSTDNGHRPLASNKFGERMRLLGLGSHRTKTGRYYPVRLTRGWG